MKILFLAPGNSVHSLRWIEFFARKGHEIHWISLNPFTAGTIPGVQLHDFSQARGGFLSLLRCAWRIRGLTHALAPQVVHAHSAAIYGFMGAVSGFHPLVVTAWGSDIMVNGESAIKRPIVKFILRAADVVTCDAEHMIAAIERLGRERGRTTMIRFGVDLARFKPAAHDAELRRSLGIGEGPAVISMRNFYPVYDIQTLLRAIPLVLVRAPAARFFLVGSGPQEEELKRLASELKLDASVRFVGKLAGEDLPRYLTSMDVYVSTSLSDAGIASSTAEAMACGLASIVTDSGENRLWISDGVDGFVVPVGDPAALADRIVALIEDAGLRAKFGERGRRVIEERNDYTKEMGAMERIYAQLAGGG